MIKDKKLKALSWHFRKLPFWERVKAYTEISSTGCHLFKGPLDDFGYARIWNEHRKQIRVHRAMWEKANGPIPHKMVIMHTCDVRNCINLAHLRLGTQRENVLDREHKGRGNHMIRVQEYVFGCA